MLDTLQTYLLFGTTFCGIEHTTQNKVEAVLLQKKKNEVIIHTSFVVNTVEELSKRLPKKQHAFLVVNNNDVLTKFIQSNEKDSSRLLYEAFPNLNSNDFYVEIHSQGDFHHIVICRKSIVDNIIASYKKYHIPIVGFSLGNTLSSFINDFIEVPVYYTSNAQLTKGGTEITGIKLLEEAPLQTYSVNGLEVTNSELLAFSGGLSYILQATPTESNFDQEKTRLATDFKQQRFFTQFLMFGLGFVLLLLLINFFYFNSYYTAVEEMKQTAAVNGNQKEKLLNLKASIDQKQKTVEDVLKNASSRSSFYIDAIVNSLPNTIQLSTVAYQPLSKRIKKNVRIQLVKNELIISGVSTDSNLFFQWIQTLEGFDWIKNVTPTNYGSDSKSIADFTLKIEMADE